jgi:CDP-diacylglycerol--glycerol-3-phosphate 3-phosphatidyltransferase
MQKELGNLRREWGGVLAVCLLLLAAGYFFLDRAWTGEEHVLWTCISAGVIAYQLGFLWKNLPANHAQGESEQRFGRLGLANWITTIRAALLALLTGFIFLPWPEGPARWAPGGLYLTASILDFMDGWAARVTHQTSRLGEMLDLHWDGFGMLVAGLLLVLYGQAPVFYVLVGLARYLFLGGMWLREKRGVPNHPMQPSTARRALAGAQMGFVAVVLLPVFKPPVTSVAATLFMLPLLAGFLRDWLVVSGVVHVRPGIPVMKARQTKVWKWMRTTIPILFRFSTTMLLASALIREMQAVEPQLGLLLASGAGLLLIGLGVLGRTAALMVMLMCGFVLRSSVSEGLYWAILLSGAGVLLAGTGRYSLWKPEEWLITHKAGEANQPR